MLQQVDIETKFVKERDPESIKRENAMLTQMNRVIQEMMPAAKNEPAVGKIKQVSFLDALKELQQIADESNKKI